MATLAGIKAKKTAPGAASDNKLRTTSKGRRAAVRADLI